jgi:hypothetical protein
LGFESNNPLGNLGYGRVFEATGGGCKSKLVVPARGKLEGIGELVAFAGAKFEGGGSVGDGAESKLRVVKLLADKVGAVRRRVRAVGGCRSVSGERGGVFKQE